MGTDAKLKNSMPNMRNKSERSNALLELECAKFNQARYKEY